MKAFRVDGQAPFGRLRQKFSLDVVASSKDDAEHRVYSIIGSRHKATRREISIQSVNEIDPRTSSEPTVLHHFRQLLQFLLGNGGELSVHSMFGDRFH